MAFRDKYTDFTFDDKKSSSYKVWITNKNDIQLALTPNFKDKFTSPQFGGVRYLDGTTIEKSDIKISCIAIDVTLNEWRAICNWLSPTKIGKLSFGFNDYSYYTVKLSSTVTAKMFNYGGKDSVIGGRKIIEFSLSFTTVGDYAALGPINTGKIGLETTSTSVTDIANELVTRSINAFHMPCVYSDANTVKTKDCVTGLELQIDTNNVQWITSDSVNYRVEYSESDQLWHHKIFKLEGANTLTYYDNPHIGSTIAVDQPQSKLVDPSDTSTDISVNTTSLNVFNTGEYELYPKIQLNNVTNSFEVWLDDVLYYQYKLSSGRVLNNIVIDCQSGAVTYNGRFMENASDAFGYTLLSESYNLGPLAIPTGEPEIHYAKFIETTTENDFDKLKFILAEPMIQDYHDTIDLGVCIFRNIKNSVKFDEGLYDRNYYEPHMIGNNTETTLDNKSFVYMDVHSYVEQYDTNDPRKVKITVTPSQFSAAYNGSSWIDTDLGNAHKNQLFYVSFCKGHRLTIKVNDTNPTGTTSFISMQSRGAI